MLPDETNKDFTFHTGEEGSKMIESVLDPTKEIAVDSDLMLEGDMLELAKRMEEKKNQPYEEKTPIRIGGSPAGRTQQQLVAYRKKRKKKNKAAKKSRRTNRKKK